MKQIIKHLCLLLITITGFYAQNIKFLKKYTFPGMNGGLGACMTSDGGIAITGQHEDGYCKVYIAKINKCGALQWYKVYDFGGSAGGLNITETYDGGLAVAAAADASASDYDWLVMKVDANGNYLWHDLWRNTPLGTSAEWAQSITELPNHYLVAGGGTSIWNNSCDGALSFYDQNGNYLYTKKLVGSNYDMIKSVASNSTYIYAMGVTASFGAGQADIFVVKLDIYGNVLWIKVYGTNMTEGDYSDTFHKCYITKDGGLLIASREKVAGGTLLANPADGTNSLLIKIDKNGVLQWAKTYSFGNGPNQAHSVVVHPNGNILVDGLTYGSQVFGGREAFLAALDSNGNVIQTNNLGFPYDDSFIEIFNYPGRRILAVGNTQEGYAGSGDYDPFIAVLDSMGNCQGCPNVANVAYAFKDITSSIVTTTLSPQIYWQNHNVSNFQRFQSEKSVSPGDNFVCATCNAITPTFTLNRTNLCAGDTLKITNTTPYSDACLEWYINNAPINPHSNDTSLVYNTPGTYTLSMQTTCGTTVITTSQTVQVYPTMTISAVTNSVSCYGGTNGSATVSASGGMQPYNYLWTPSAQTGSVMTGVPTGPYTVSVSDAGACGSTYTTVNIPQPISSPSIVVLQTQSVSCYGANDGSITVNSYGGTGTISYSWVPGGMTTPSITGLSPNIYTLTITDANNCMATTTIQIIEPPALSITVSSGSVSCNGGSDGWVSATAGGGAGGYSYTWTPSNSNNSYVSNLPIGHYSVVVKDLNNCFISDTISIIQPSALTITAQSNSATCYGIPTGSGTVSVSGGMGGYQYQWLPIGGSQSVATNLPGGTYTINVLDANQCPISTTLLVNQPSSITLITSPDATICYGTTTNIFANASGGNAPYNYHWSDGSIGSGPFSISPLSSSFYNVYVTDTTNCQSETKTIKITVLPPITVVPSMHSICDKDTIVITSNAYGGNGGPYTYLWNTGSTTNTLMVVGDYAQNPMTFTLNVSDGCTNPNGTAVYTINIHPLPILSFNSNVTNGCIPLKVTFNVQNGSSFDNYLWDFGNGQTGSTNPAQSIYSIVDTFDIKLKMTTMFGCQKDTTVPKYIITYPLPSASFYPEKPILSELDGEEHFINTSNGGITYFWNFGDPNSTNNVSNNFHATHLYNIPDTYTVTLVVTNQYGCSDTAVQIINVKPDVSVYIPNAFTPDGDGLNDVFKPEGVGIQNTNYKMQIYDRWGEMIFQSLDFDIGWDGTYRGSKAETGVYAYIIVLYDIKGYKHFYKGHLSLLTN